MRLQDYFLRNAVAPYTRRKKLLNLNILEKVYHIDKRYLIFAMLTLVLFLISGKYSLFFALTAISAVFSYYHSKLNRTPVDFKFALLFGLFITRIYGIHFTLVFFIISDIIPNLLGGSSIDAATLVFTIWYFIINAIVYLFPTVPLTVLGPILVVVEAVGSFFINSFFGIPGVMSIMVSIISVIVRIIYFLTIGKILELLVMGG